MEHRPVNQFLHRKTPVLLRVNKNKNIKIGKEKNKDI
jgi:hypothetical protein